MTKKNKSTSGKQKKANPVVVVVCAVIALVSVCCIGFYLVNEAPATIAKEKMAAYLKNKYGKDFEVERPTLGNGGFGVSGTWSADAYPADNKEDRFSVMKSETRESFADQYTALIWSKRETERINKIAQEGAERWKVDAIVRIYLAEPLSETALPDNSNMEDIIKQDHGLSYTVELSYVGLEDDVSIDDMAYDANRITSIIRNSEIHNLDIDYSISTKQGVAKLCKTTYDEPFNYSYDSIKSCLK